MSVRSYTHSGNPLPAGGAIVTTDADGVSTLEGILCGVAPDRGTGTAGEVLTSKGDGTMSWQTGGGAGTPTTLAIAMNNGNVASQDLYMGGFDISSESSLEIETAVGDLSLVAAGDVRIGAVGSIELVAPQGLKVGATASAGVAGSVLLSMGPGAEPEWTVPGIPTAMDDLNMNGFDIVQCGDINATAAMAITSSATTMNGPVSFGTDYPAVDSQVIAAGGPPADESLTTKKYVDDTIAGVAGVAPAGDNVWTGSNDFSNSQTALGGAAGTTIINVNSGVVGSGVSLINTSQGFTRYQTTTNAVMTPAHPIFYVMAYMTEADSFILLPGNFAEYDGCKITILNCAFDLEIRAANADGTGRIRNFSGNHGTQAGQPWTTTYARAELASGHSISFVCSQVEAGDYYWCVIDTSDSGLGLHEALN